MQPSCDRAAWGMIGPMQLVTSTDGQPLYMQGVPSSSQKTFTNASTQSFEVDFHEQFLAVAQELDKTIAELTTDNALSLISGLKEYQNMPEFLA